MSRADSATWRTAYDNFVKCGHSPAGKELRRRLERDAAQFIDAEHKDYVRERGRLLSEDAAALLARGAAALLQAAQCVDLA